MQKNLKKLISAILVIIIILANSATLISYAADSLMTSEELEKQTVATNDSNVEFDVYYDNGAHTKELDINSKEESINLDINVKNAGYLKDISVDFSASNFNIAQIEGSKAQVNSVNKKVTFDQINNGSHVVGKVNLSAIKEDTISLENLSKDNSIELTAKYVNAKGNEVEISKTITLQTIWTDPNQVEANFEYNINTYYIHEEENNNKLILLGQAKAGLSEETLPIKSTTIEITAPQINNTYPENAYTSAKSTTATNGDNTGVNFTSDNYSYDVNTGKLTITVENKETNGKISWIKNTLDEYNIAFVYSEEVLEAVKDEKITAKENATLQMSLYGGKNIEPKTISKDAEEISQSENSVLLSIIAPETLSKGYMYNNKTTAEENKKETEYEAVYSVNIPYANIIDKIAINIKKDMPIVEDTEIVSTKSLSYIKTLLISKVEFDKILGEEGNITIKNSEGVTLNISQAIVEGGYIILDLSEYNADEIIIETSKPKTEGSLNFYIEKAINKDLSYSTTQIKSFEKLKLEVATEETSKVQTTINFEETSHKVDLSLSTETLSTVVKNENVDISVTLENDSADDAMFSNPEVLIELPNNIKEITINDKQLLFDDELQIETIEIVDNEDGTKSIKAKLNGTQTKYNNVMAKGATLSIKADITLNYLTPTTIAEITATVTNDNGTIAQVAKNIKYVAPTGLFTTTEVTGITSEPAIVVNENLNIPIDPRTEQKEVKFSMTAINNYQNDLDNIVVLGRIPTTETTSLTSTESLGSNASFALKEAINVTNINSENTTIYYSKNGAATTDLSNAQNAWTTTVENFSEIKSYMIVLNDYQMTEGEKFIFTYTAIIPQNIGFEKTIVQNYAIFFNNNQTAGTIQDKIVAPQVTFTTEKNATLSASLQLIENDNSSLAILQGGTLATYRLTIKNTGDKVAEDIFAKIKLPDGAIWIGTNPRDPRLSDEGPMTEEEIEAEDEKWQEMAENNQEVVEDGEIQEINGAVELTEEQKDVLSKMSGMITEDAIKKLRLYMGTLEPNEETTIDIPIVYYNANNDKEVSINADIICQDELVTTTNTVTIQMQTGNLTLNAAISNAKTNGEDFTTIGDTVYYNLLIQPYVTEAKNVIATINLPEELEYVSTKISNGISAQTDITSENSIKTNGNVITIELGNIEEARSIIITAKVKKLEETNQKDIIVKATVKQEDDSEEMSIEAPITISKAGLSVEQTCNIPSRTTIEAGEQFAYTFSVKNLSQIPLQDITLSDLVPNGLAYQSLELSISEGTPITSDEVDENGEHYITFTLMAEETATITLNVKASSLENETQITNKATVQNELIGEIETNSITHTIKEFDKSNISDGTGNNPTEPTVKTRKIIGTVWVDGNANGIKDIGEQTVSEVQVLLLDNNTGNIAVTSEEELATAITDNDGAYMFNNIEQGTYTVIFLYDSENYSATLYQKDGVDESKNSNAVDKTIEYAGETRVAGVTEEIKLSEENVYNINLGLVSNKKFDLSLSKTVSTITVNDSKNVASHTYNSNFAKIDFEAKYADTSTMIVEYKFTIKNEGEISGYVKKVADYVPEGLSFNSELNADWYEAQNGLLLNNSLANKLINPGESLELTLVLTKNMTSDAMGIVITNTAEIYEASNDYGVVDADSTPANKKENEDDMSIANVLTSVKTGQTVYYIALTIVIITILGVGIYFIKKKVIK